MNSRTTLFQYGKVLQILRLRYDGSASSLVIRGWPPRLHCHSDIYAWLLSFAFWSARLIPYLRINSWYHVFPSLCQHGTFCVGILHLHQETPWNSGAPFNSANRLHIFVLLRTEMQTSLLFRRTLKMTFQR